MLTGIACMVAGTEPWQPLVAIAFGLCRRTATHTHIQSHSHQGICVLTLIFRNGRTTVSSRANHILSLSVSFSLELFSQQNKKLNVNSHKAVCRTHFRRHRAMASATTVFAASLSSTAFFSTFSGCTNGGSLACHKHHVKTYDLKLYVGYDT